MIRIATFAVAKKIALNAVNFWRGLVNVAA